MSLPYLREFGWEGTVLAVEPGDVLGVRDPVLERTVPSDTPVVRVRALSHRATKYIGMATLGLRSLPTMRRAGDRLLAQAKAEGRPFDVVFFSTTQFPVMSLGPRWKKRFGVPYVLDFQDPWRSDYYRQSGVRPPGGKLKYAISQSIARLLEPETVRRAAAIISVSPKYPDMLRERYPGALSPEQCTVLPFGAPEADFEMLPHSGGTQDVFNPGDGLRHWVYVGRGGADMARALRLLFRAVREEREAGPAGWDRVRMHFVGTSYAPKGRAVPTIAPVAEDEGVADLVQERPDRIPYFEAMRAMQQADAVLAIGSDDPMYTASKIYPCILARRPILAIFHEASSVVPLLRSTQAGQVATFGAGSEEEAVGQLRQVLREWVGAPGALPPPETNWSVFAPYTAREMTRRQCEVFERALS